MSQDKLDGASLITKCLKEQGVEYMFGVVGIPVIEIALRAQQYGIKYVGMRNEQAASYAASAIGYLTRKPAVALCVSGPGFVHTLAGMSNANENAWPLLVIGGSSDLGQESQGAFQEYPQVALGRNFAKYSARPSSLSNIPFFVEKAYRNATYGRPGAAYLDFSAEMITSTIEPDQLLSSAISGEAPRPLASPDSLKNVFESLNKAKKPLIVIGKGAAYSQAEEEINKLIDSLGFPFLPTPMGKGVVDDDHNLCVSAARSTALKEADLIVLLGARLNWMLHFGQPPRFAENVKIIQVDINAEELGNNSKDCIKIQADLRSFSNQMNEFLMNKKIQINQQWWNLLRKKVEKNKNVIQSMANDLTLPLNYYAAYAQIKKVIPKDSIVVSEGANTMDTSRSILNHSEPRHRLDAGSFGTMGVGSGFAIAAALHCRDYHPNKKVLCIQGDSAFGFGGMEIETAYRYNLPIVFIIFNNNGIYGGLDKESFDGLKESGDPTISLPPMSLTSGTRYEKFAGAFENFKGYYARTPDEICSALSQALSETKTPSIINIEISPSADRKAQEFPWLTKSKL